MFWRMEFELNTIRRRLETNSEVYTHSGVARPQFLGEHIDINKLLLINIYFNRDLYYVVALYTNGHDRIGRFCSYQLNRASSLWTFLYVVTIINERPQFLGNIVPPKFPQSSPKVPPKFPQSSPKVPPKFPQSSPKVPPKFPQSSPKVPPKFPQNSPKVPPKFPQSSPKVPQSSPVATPLIVHIFEHGKCGEWAKVSLCTLASVYLTANIIASLLPRVYSDTGLSAELVISSHRA